MKITEIVVSAGRTFNHPYESYSNFKPQVTLKATLTEKDEPIAATKKLQAAAEQLVEEQKQRMLQDLEDLQNQARRQATIASLERTIKQAQDELAEMREAKALVSPGETEDDDDNDDEEEMEDEDEVAEADWRHRAMEPGL
jgi:Zn-dependent M16 (insulinase) family peptidase